MNRRAFFRTLAGAAISAASWCYAGPKLLAPTMQEELAWIREEWSRILFEPRPGLKWIGSKAKFEWDCDEIMPDAPDA